MLCILSTTIEARKFCHWDNSRMYQRILPCRGHLFYVGRRRIWSETTWCQWNLQTSVTDVKDVYMYIKLTVNAESLVSGPVCDRMWICSALSLPRTLRQRRQRCLKMVDESSLPISPALSDCRITVTFGGFTITSQPSLHIIILGYVFHNYLCIQVEKLLTQIIDSL